ncbi:hypothetical protein ACOSP7_023934 [Xanthoceras sorbifolium]
MDTIEVERLCAAMSLVESEEPVAMMAAELQVLGETDDTVGELVEGTQGRENVGPDNQEIARLGKTGGDVGGEVVKDLGVAPLTEKLCTEVVIDAVGGHVRD